MTDQNNRPRIVQESIRSRGKRNFLAAIFMSIVIVMLVSRASLIDIFNFAFHGEVALSSPAEAQVRRAPQFQINNSIVPQAEILSGGPPKDGIPAISRPALLNAKDANFMGASDRIIGVVLADEARAYPLKILNYHEIVNDRVGDTSFAVTYCPLCDSSAVIDRGTPLGEREFGVSGLLYNSNVLMYDRSGKQESLWSQIMGKAIAGAAVRQPLTYLPIEVTTWSDWRSRYPRTLVLSTKTGYQRDYSRSPYGSYFQSPNLMFPVKLQSDRMPAKSRVLGVWTESATKAYPIDSFADSDSQIKDKVGGVELVLDYSAESKSLRIVTAGEGVQWMYSFWFAWYAFHPESDVFIETQTNLAE